MGRVLACVLVAAFAFRLLLNRLLIGSVFDSRRNSTTQFRGRNIAPSVLNENDGVLRLEAAFDDLRD